MVSNNVLNIFFAVGLIIALVVYHLTNYFVENISVKDIYAIAKIAQTVVSGIVAFLFIFNPLATKLILRDKYIAGNYEGQSGYYLDDKSEKKKHNKPEQVEFFTIIQNVFETRISGHSFHKGTNTLNSTWEGKLIKIDGKTFYFALELSTHTTQFGTLKATFRNKYEIVGFYYSADIKPNSVSSFSAKKVNKKNKMQTSKQIRQDKE